MVECVGHRERVLLRHDRLRQRCKRDSSVPYRVLPDFRQSRLAAPRYDDPCRGTRLAVLQSYMATATETTQTRTAAAIPPQVRPIAAPRRRRWQYLAAILVVGATAFAAARVLPRLTATPPQPVVTASGRIEGREVTLAAKDIQARVKRLLVDEGDTVKRGQLLAELEANSLEARIASLEAAVASIDAQIRQASIDVGLTAKNIDASIAAAEAAVSSARARVTRATAIHANATADQQRAIRLFNDNVISRHELDQLEMTVRTSEADVDAADKDLARTQADLRLARASKDTIGLKQQHVRALQASRRAATGQLAEVRANLAECQVVAPTDGTILSRPVEVGDVVSPGSPVFVMVDMSRLYVKVYVPEPDIPKLKLGDPAEIVVDAFPHRRFAARVSKIHEQAEFTPKNVETAEERLKLVFGVELTFVNPDRLLKPGMPADCIIHWTTTE
jgi:membrane fusion protein YbhG